jgi:ssDNA-binding Zn-finger/Zn-ribbon topoisomerase 1
MRRCGRCGWNLEEHDFYSGQRWCKGCLKAASGDALRKRRTRAKQFLLNYLREHPCTDCGQGDPVVLEFDHLRDKTRSLTQLAHDGVTIATLEQEIEKCEVVCAICHRLRTKRRRTTRASADPVAARNVAFAKAVLAERRCTDCGETRSDTLDFDHVGQKTASVMILAWRAVPLGVLSAEIARCEIRCANCHRRRTARTGRHYRYVALNQPL